MKKSYCDGSGSFRFPDHCSVLPNPATILPKSCEHPLRPHPPQSAFKASLESKMASLLSDIPANESEADLDETLTKLSLPFICEFSFHMRSIIHNIHLTPYSLYSFDSHHITHNPPQSLPLNLSSTLASIISSSTSDVKQIRELDKELRNVNEEVEILSQISLVSFFG